MMKQKGFTLLELLVVITLLAVLAVGALVAYDGIGENAESTAAAFNAGSLDRAVRAYRSVEQAYPDQWDNLAHSVNGNSAGTATATDDQDSDNEALLLHPASRAIFGSWNLGGADAAVQTAFDNVVENVWGMEEIQNVDSLTAGVTPAKMHNEGSHTGAVERGFNSTDIAYISIVPSANGAGGGLGCQVGSQSVSKTFADTASVTGAAAVDMARRLNAMNDAMGIERCHLVVALGFGGDTASSTSRSTAAIVSAPSYSSKTINPANHYARYVGLFHVARTSTGASNVTINETNFFARPKLIGFVDTVGNPIDVNAATARSSN